MKKIWAFLRKNMMELILLLVGFIVGAVIFTKRKEEDILSEVGNAIDVIEADSKKEADEIKRKLDMIKEIKDKQERMRRLLKLKEEIDRL